MDALKLALIPLIAGLIGYATNWLAVKMLFFPLGFAGFRIPLLGMIGPYLPKRIQSFPGITEGRVGWQGLIPAKAAKMGSIAVDKGIAKLGRPGEFYREFDPETLTAHIVEESREDVSELIERVMRREHPRLWSDLPPAIREAVHERVQAHLPELVREVMEEIGDNIESLMDVKLMVIRHIEANPELANRVFLEVGEREFRFIINSGFAFGFLLGLPLTAAFATLEAFWVLPLGGLFVGYITNLLALQVIFRPLEPRRIGPLRLHGLFMRRQPEVADTYSQIIADDVITLTNVGRDLLNGPKSDRTRRLIAARLRPAIDQALGIASPAVRIAVGTHEYDAIRDSLATESVEFTMTPLTDPSFSRARAGELRELMAARMRELPRPDFAELLRSAFQEDEWMLIAVGAALGGLAGTAQILFVF